MTKLNYHLRHPLHPVMPVARTEITLNCGISIISAFVLVNKHFTLSSWRPLAKHMWVKTCRFFTSALKIFRLLEDKVQGLNSRDFYLKWKK